jgi:hypothetical protein
MLKHTPRKVLTQPRSKHEVSLQNDSPGLDHCCFIKTFDRVILWIRLINLYFWKLDSFTLPMQFESSKTDLRFESYGRLKTDLKTVRKRDARGQTRDAKITSDLRFSSLKKTRDARTLTRDAKRIRKLRKRVLKLKSTNQTSKSNLETIPQHFTSINKHKHQLISQTHFQNHKNPNQRPRTQEHELNPTF